jgi:glycosyltransferase involved in cell wall biosynthesis
MKICIVAEHASRQFGGEALLPYQYFRLLRERGVEAWLVVHARTRPELEKAFAHDLDHLCFVDDLWVHKLLFRMGTVLPRRVEESTLGLASQLFTQFLERRIVARLMREHGVEVLHQPIPIAPRFPSVMSGVGIPVIVGPLNGGMDFPPAFRKKESPVVRAVVATGRYFSNFANSILPGKKEAAVVLVANQRTREVLPSGVRGRVIEMAENGVDLSIYSDDGALPSRSHRFVFIGRLVDWKAAHIAIKAMASVPGAELDIIGDGPMRAEWMQLAQSLGLEDRVHFLGYQPEQACAEQIRQSVALLCPSLFEAGGGVVLQAMALRKPVIATRWGGPADYLDASCGILVDPVSEELMVEGFADAMRCLLGSPDLCEQLGTAGRERLLREFDWEKKIDRMLEIYASVLPAR